jgi:predicted nucleotide-binding protein
VLLTPDDIGASRTHPIDRQSRARQNVVFELGYFTGKLGRSKVCALFKEGLELPSDYEGIVYVQMTADGGWQLRLAKELKAAGIDVDLNKTM